MVLWMSNTYFNWRPTCLKHLASETSCFDKKSDDGRGPKKEDGISKFLESTVAVMYTNWVPLAAHLSQMRNGDGAWGWRVAEVVRWQTSRLCSVVVSCVWVWYLTVLIEVCLCFKAVHSFIPLAPQNATIPCCSQELLPFLSVMYFCLPPFSTNYSSILSHLILPSTSWSTSQSCCSLLGIPFSSILCTCPNQHNLFNLIVSVIVGFLTLA